MPRSKLEKDEIIRQVVAQRAELVEELTRWRRQRAREDDCEAYMVFDNKTLHDMVYKMPKTTEDMVRVKGIKAIKCQRYGDDLLEVIAKYHHQYANQEVRLSQLSPQGMRQVEKERIIRERSELANRLRHLRKMLARQQSAIKEKEVKPFHIFWDNPTLEELVYTMPRNKQELLKIPHIGTQKCQDYGDQILAEIDACRHLYN